MWRDFFPNAQIYGADTLPQLVFHDDRIETFRCDQTVKKDLENLIAKTGSDIDLFIDDGSHLPKDQVFTCLTVMPMLKKSVIYLIEDAGASQVIETYLGNFDYHIIKFKNARYRDDKLIVVKQK